jgi:hypothetical protein
MSHPPPKKGVQASLTEETFQERLKGFQEVTPDELIDMPQGGMLRYAIYSEYKDKVYSKYRLGGILIDVDESLRFIKLLAPYKTSTSGERFVWKVKLRRRPGETIKLYYRPQVTHDEISVFRTLLERLDKGEIEIVPKKR